MLDVHAGELKLTNKFEANLREKLSVVRLELFSQFLIPFQNNPVK